MKAGAKSPPGSAWPQGCPQPSAGGQSHVLPCRWKKKTTWSKFGTGLQMPFGGEKAPGQAKEAGTRRLRPLACRLQEMNGTDVLAGEFRCHRHRVDLPQPPGGIRTSLGQLLRLIGEGPTDCGHPACFQTTAATISALFFFFLHAPLLAA